MLACAAMLALSATGDAHDIHERLAHGASGVFGAESGEIAQNGMRRGSVAVGDLDSGYRDKRARAHFLTFHKVPCHKPIARRAHAAFRCEARVDT